MKHRGELGLFAGVAHTSGHADPNSLVRLAQALNPRKVVPIHTEAPQTMASLIQNVCTYPDGEWFEA
jgi:ribonuclease J